MMRTPVALLLLAFLQCTFYTVGMCLCALRHTCARACARECMGMQVCVTVQLPRRRLAPLPHRIPPTTHIKHVWLLRSRCRPNPSACIPTDNFAVPCLRRPAHQLFISPPLYACAYVRPLCACAHTYPSLPPSSLSSGWVVGCIGEAVARTRAETQAL